MHGSMKILKSFKVCVIHFTVQCATQIPVEMSVSVILICLSSNVIRTGRAWISGSLLAVHICPSFVKRLSSYPNLFP